MYDIVIIGAGPAGLTAAIYACRARKKVLVLEALTYGGQIISTNKIVNYPGFKEISGVDFATNLYEQAKDLGAEFKFDKAISIDTKDLSVTTNNDTYKTRAIILAMGVNNKKTGLENEDKFVGRGLSYCATCDGNFYKGLDVALVGGGNTAISDALYLSNIVNKIYLIHRRDEFRADEKDVNLLKKKKNIEFVYNSNVTKLFGDNKLDSVEVTNLNNEKRIIKVSGLFVAIGQVPMNDYFNNLIKVDNSGYVISKENCHTNCRGIFVAGDIRKKSVRQLVTATSDGAVSAMEAVKYLKNN